jgi:hypothetical protein
LTLAFVADWDGDLEIYVVNADGSELSKLTDNLVDDYGASWSPDGARIAYISDSYDPRLRTMNADGSDQRVLRDDIAVSGSNISWSTLGDTVAFRSARDLYTVDIESGEAKLIVSGDDFFPDELILSPDGAKIAFTADILEGSPRMRLFAANIDGTGLTELSFPEGEVNYPSWHPFLEQIAFQAFIPSVGGSIYTIDLDGNLALVAEIGSGPPRWSPDGSLIGYFDRWMDLDASGEYKLPLDYLHIAATDGSVDLVVLQPPDEPFVGLALTDFVWAPDNRHLAYLIPSEDNDADKVDLHILDICSGTSALVAEAIDKASTPSWTTERIPIIAATATDTEFDFTGLIDKWLTYRNETYGFSFEYPAVYAEGPYAFCDLREIPIQDGVMITIGMRSDLYVFDAQGQTIEEYVDSTIEEHQRGDPDWQLTNRKATTQAGVDAVSIDYRFGGLGRIGSAKVFKRGEYLYVFNFTFGAFCDVPEIGFYEWDAYPRMVNSFKWLDE